MDRFRIQALERIIAHPELSSADRYAACEMLTQKAGIMAQGALKRGKDEQANIYLEKQQRYLQFLGESKNC